MKFYSEKTKKYYDKADDCVADEAKFDKELAQKEEAAALAKAEKEKAVALRKEEAKKIEEKIAERAKLDKEIDTLMNEFTKNMVHSIIPLKILIAASRTFLNI